MYRDNKTMQNLDFLNSYLVPRGGRGKNTALNYMKVSAYENFVLFFIKFAEVGFFSFKGFDLHKCGEQILNTVNFVKAEEIEFFSWGTKNFFYIVIVKQVVHSMHGLHQKWLHSSNGNFRKRHP